MYKETEDHKKNTSNILKCIIGMFEVQDIIYSHCCRIKNRTMTMDKLNAKVFGEGTSSLVYNHLPNAFSQPLIWCDIMKRQQNFRGDERRIKI